LIRPLYNVKLLGNVAIIPASTMGLPWFEIDATKKEHAILYLRLSIID
jgi:hypothetical protein